MRKRTIIKGTIILTISGILTRILGFVNRVYLSNLIGAEGIGLYQLVFPVYMICYTICCTGLFTAITRLTAEENAKGSKANAKKLVLIATTISVLISIVLMILLYFNAQLICTRLIGEPRIAIGIKIIAFSIPFTALAHSIKGYFYGLNKPTLPAIAQLIEQIIRIAVIMLLSSTLIDRGLEYALAAAVIGVTVSEMISCIMVVIYFHAKTSSILIKKATQSYLYFSKRIASIAVPLTSNRLITSFLSSVELLLIPTKLQAFGFSHSYAINIFGTLTGMALPLIYFPTVVTTAASLMLLPAISEAYAKGQKTVIKKTVAKTIKFTLIMGIFSTFFFLRFGSDLGNIIFNEPYVGTLLMILCWICPFLYLQTTLGSILNGLNKHMITFRNSIIGLVIRIGFIYTFIPIWGLKGYLIGLVVSVVIVSSLHIYHLVRTTAVNFDAMNFILKPVFCCLAGLSAIYMIKYFIVLPSNAIYHTGLLMAIYCLITLASFYISQCITIEDIKG
jgi:stage V sporulation protein B